MTMNDLTAPLGQDPRNHRRAIDVPVTKIIAVALGLFFAAFVLWAVIGQDRSGSEPVAVAPADLRLAKKAPEVIAVPQAAAPTDSKEATTTTLAPPAPAKSPVGVTVTIIDGKTGATREVVVAAPPQAATAAEPTRRDQNSADTTGQLPTQLPSQLPSQPPKKKH
jgi:hypothetical protein